MQVKLLRLLEEKTEAFEYENMSSRVLEMSNYRYDDDDDDDGQSTAVGRDVVFHRFHMCYARFFDTD